MRVGRKKGQKRSDHSFTAPDGSEWDSRFEWLVYQGAVDAGIQATKNTDPIPYTRIVPRASCQDCGSTRCGEARRITFDLLVNNRDSVGKENSYYLESKGYMRAPKRSLYRSFFKERQDVSVRFIIQSNFRVGKGSFGEWISKHLHSPWFLWKGTWPKESEWIFPTVKNSVKRSAGSRKGAKRTRKEQTQIIAL